MDGFHDSWESALPAASMMTEMTTNGERATNKKPGWNESIANHPLAWIPIIVFSSSIIHHPGLIRRQDVIALDDGMGVVGKTFNADHGAGGGFGGDLIIGAELEILTAAQVE